jgi:hypothetical protein
MYVHSLVQVLIAGPLFPYLYAGLGS